jgi:hypothetical protein
MFVFVAAAMMTSMASAAIVQMDWNSPMPEIGNDIKALQSGLPIVLWVRRKEKSKKKKKKKKKSKIFKIPLTNQNSMVLETFARIPSA